MNDEDFIALIRLVEKQLREVGLAEVADPINYLDHGYVDAEMKRSIETPRLPPPRDHLIALLEAFDTQLMLRDQKFVQASISIIRSHSAPHYPTDAIVYTPGEEAIINLKDLPELSGLRDEIKEIIEIIRGSRDSTSKPGGLDDQ